MYSTEQTEASTNENHNGLLPLGIVFLVVGVTFLATSSVSTWISWVFLGVAGIFLLNYMDKRYGNEKVG